VFNWLLSSRAMLTSMVWFCDQEWIISFIISSSELLSEEWYVMLKHNRERDYRYLMCMKDQGHMRAPAMLACLVCVACTNVTLQGISAAIPCRRRVPGARREDKRRTRPKLRLDL